jgi:hypothetical protein
MVSQPSAGHVVARTARTDSEPDAPVVSRCHSAGVPVGERSSARNPGMPTNTTGPVGGAAIAALEGQLAARRAAPHMSRTLRITLNTASPATSIFVEARFTRP